MDTREIKEVYLRTKEALENTVAENIRLKQQIEQLKVEKAELHEEWFLKNAKTEQLLYEALEGKKKAESERDLAEELYNENADRLIEALKLDAQVTLGHAVDYALEAINKAKTLEVNEKYIKTLEEAIVAVSKVKDCGGCGGLYWDAYKHLFTSWTAEQLKPRAEIIKKERE